MWWDGYGQILSSTWALDRPIAMIMGEFLWDLAYNLPGSDMGSFSVWDGKKIKEESREKRLDNK
jgi:hypothetical protein